VARGNHGHAQLHNAVTVVDSNTVDFTLAVQQITATVRLAPSAGLIEIPTSGIGADFGPGHQQVARGDHVHANDHLPVTTANSPSLALSVDANQVLSGTVRPDPNPPPGGGRIIGGGSGVFVDLGSGTQQAAPGVHGHAVATTGSDGFMSATDKLHTDQMYQQYITGGPAAPVRKDFIRITLENAGAVLPANLKQYVVIPYSGTITGWDIIGDITSGTIVVDVKKSSFGAFPPSASIAGTEKPTLTVQQAAQKVPVTSWSTALVPNDVLAFEVQSGVGSVKRVMVQVRVDRQAN
jgi:hypothetical protein